MEAQFLLLIFASATLRQTSHIHERLLKYSFSFLDYPAFAPADAKALAGKKASAGKHLLVLKFYFIDQNSRQMAGVFKFRLSRRAFAVVIC